jgi:signal transduction histidine kinase
LPDGRDGRYVAQRIEVHHVFPEEGPDRPTAARLVLVVAQGREELVALERMLLAQCVGACILLAGLIAALSWLAVERGLEPARRLAARLDAIRVDDLPAQLEAGELPAELAPVADKIDALIGRVQTALSRERRTTADIAHELRTPVSELLTVSEVALRDGNDARAGRIALAKVRDVAWRMGARSRPCSSSRGSRWERRGSIARASTSEASCANSCARSPRLRARGGSRSRATSGSGIASRATRRSCGSSSRIS